MIAIHSTSKPISCPYCNLGFPFKRGLTRHEENNEPIKCKFCEAKITKKCLLKVRKSQNQFSFQPQQSTLIQQYPILFLSFSFGTKVFGEIK